jgi:F-type H+-transporting ATPase subunit epsilon
MFLEIITPEKKLFSGETELVQLPGAAGSFEVLKNHAALISNLTAGNIKVKESDGSFTYFEIKGGVVEVLNNNISVLVD